MGREMGREMGQVRKMRKVREIKATNKANDE
jgi:hypothetical protein